VGWSGTASGLGNGLLSTGQLSVRPRHHVIAAEQKERSAPAKRAKRGSTAAASISTPPSCDRPSTGIPGMAYLVFARVEPFRTRQTHAGGDHMIRESWWDGP
jgi:hypothetical protein